MPTEHWCKGKLIELQSRILGLESSWSMGSTGPWHFSRHVTRHSTHIDERNESEGKLHWMSSVGLNERALSFDSGHFFP